MLMSKRQPGFYLENLIMHLAVWMLGDAESKHCFETI